MDLQILSERFEAREQQWPDGWRNVLTHTHTYSGRDDHGGTMMPPRSYEQLAEWAHRLRIDALGMGSPYTPKSAETYHRYDGAERDRYYNGAIDPESVVDRDEIASMLAQVNRISNGKTLFYLDNETPKCRYGHLWWLGYHPDVPAWHDYDQPYDLWQLDPDRREQFEDEPLSYERRPYLEILAIQRARGALGFWAHPSSWWFMSSGQFITNIASEMPAHAVAEGYLDGMVIMGYQPYRPEYQRIWFGLLDRGYRVPGVAEMDCGLSSAQTLAKQSALLNYALVPESNLTVEGLLAAFRRGHIFASSGPFIELTVDGHPMGDIARTSRQQAHTVQITALPQADTVLLGRVELIGPGGQVLWNTEGFTGGTITLRISGLVKRGYLVARILASDSSCQDWRQPSRVAVSNPVYLHPFGSGFEAPALTAVTVTILPDSPFAGGEILFETMRGEWLSRTVTSVGTYQETLPASGRLTLVGRDGQRRTDYLLNANPALQAVQRYLYRGRFLRDFPDARSGEIPLAAWQLDHYSEAMHAVSLTY
jgi:hypothetical protein